MRLTGKSTVGVMDVAKATLEWVAWCNNERFMEPLGYVPSAEFETQYTTHTTAAHQWVYSTAPVSEKPGAVQSVTRPPPRQ